ncbi:hypothetical protein [aff. Roholtiella sp. LEGE 12411]|uniref:hypothetical protein n=1 Tax=aff. Roholtiella sp. LEGE 12411 TaxID=1828822 RepID=UPI00188170FC|nr:hypothetical protein [aff. Roholtiella sp. LEGE 12411]MBE9036168.1 hypothetical protein [aff. Roholtiella sp. LEGE 12411]
MQIYHVDYLAPVIYLVPPVSVIISLNGLFGSDAFSEYVLRGAEGLATSSQS